MAVFRLVEPITIGQRLGPYRIQAVLGAGGTGVVYLAGDRRLLRPVAIKVLDPAIARTCAIRSLLREARMAAALVHPSICGVHEVGHIRGRPFIVMEHVEGVSLAAVLPLGVGLPLERTLHYAIQIADGVAHAHRRGIVHGDLKSTNIMVGPRGQVKVLDFGLAVQRSRAGGAPDADTTRPRERSSARGTVPYMAPELLRGRRATPRSDIWALGVVLFEMATGGRPFGGATSYEIAAAILGHHGATFPASVPAPVRQVVSKCLAINPERRFPSAIELAGSLDDIP